MFPGMAAVGSLLMSALIAAPASAPYTSTVITSPPPDKIVVDVVTVNGSGCPAGTAAIAVSPDNTAFTVTYSNYTALVGPTATTLDWRKNCQLNIIVHVPSGFSYAINQADYRGFADLAAGATALEKASYYFQGSSKTDMIQHDFKGPFSDNWHTTDVTEEGQLVYSPCGELRNFNINTEVRVSAGTSNPKTTTSFITMDSLDNSITTTYHFAWKECPKKP